MSTTNPPLPPLTPAQIAAIQQQCNLASVKSFPAVFYEIFSGLKPPASETAVFLVEEEPDGSTILTNATLPAADRATRANKLVTMDYSGIMLWDLCWLGYDHFQTFKTWRDQGITWYPPRYLKTAAWPGLLLQPALGEPGQYALPDDYHDGMGLLGPYPTTKPDGWITIPDVNALLVPGADVAALLKEMF